MPDEPSGYELQRKLQDLREDLRSVVAETGRRIDKKVSADVHAADLRRIDSRIDDLRSDIAEVVAAQERDRQTARNAKQWAVGTALSALAIVVAIVAVVGERI